VALFVIVALPAGDTTAIYGDCTVDAPWPWLSSGGHNVYSTGSIVCDTRKTLTMTVKMMVRDNVLDYWHVEDKVSKSGKGVFGLSGTVVGDCGYHPHSDFKAVVTVSINGNKKPSVESALGHC
jgi:hypothetical protein